MNNKSLLFFVFFLFFCGCATIFKGPHSTINIYAPNDIKAYDTTGEKLPLIQESDGHKKIKVESTEPYKMDFVYKKWKKTIEFTPTFQPGWLVPDIPLYAAPLFFDLITGCWNGFPDVEFVFLPHDSIVKKETGLEILPLDYDISGDYDPKLDTIIKFYRTRASFFEKYSTAVAARAFGIAITDAAMVGLIYMIAIPFGGVDVSKFDTFSYFVFTTISSFTIGPFCSAEGVIAPGKLYDEHGGYWSALGGAITGELANFIFLAIINPPDYNWEWKINPLLYFGIFTLVPPLFSIWYYDGSLPDLYLIPYGAQNSVSLINYNAGKSAFRLMPPSLSIERNPFFPNEYITKLNVLSIRF